MFVARLDLPGRPARRRRRGRREAGVLLPQVRPGHGDRRRRGSGRGRRQGPDLVAARPLRDRRRRWRPPVATTGAGCRAPRRSPAGSSATRSPGAPRRAASRTCGSSTPSSPAWPVSTPGYSFVPRWRPPFISELAPQDRCHLNGLAMRDGSPAFVTVMALSDEPGGWRKQRNDSGAVLDVASGEAVTTGLAMPHSPRWHDGQPVRAQLRHGPARARRPRHRPARGGRRPPGLRARAGLPRRISRSSACRRSVRRPSSVVHRSPRTTTSSSAASASSTSAPATRSRPCSSPPGWRRSSTYRSSPGRVVRPSAPRRRTGTTSGCSQASGSRPLRDGDTTDESRCCPGS